MSQKKTRTPLPEKPRKEAGLPRRYSWIPQPFHTNQKQHDWTDSAVTLFNVDIHDILLNGSEKRQILSFLTEKLKPNENISRLSSNPWVNLARRMCGGALHFDQLKMYGALLRYQLNPPESWYASEQMRHCLGVLQYLQRCANGRDTYTKEGVRNAPIADIPEGLESALSKAADMNCSEDHRAPQTKPASGKQSPSVKAATTSTPTPRRFIRSVFKPRSSSKTPERFVLPSVNSSYSGETPKTPTPAPRKNKIIIKTSKSSEKKSQKASSNGKTAPSSGKVDRKRKRPTDSLDQDKADTPKPPVTSRQAKRSRGDLKPVAEGWIGRFIDAASVLDRVALYVEQDVRKLALKSFIEDLERAGWDDLKQSLEQIVKDDDYESRVFLAGKVVPEVYNRIDLSVNRPSTEA